MSEGFSSASQFYAWLVAQIRDGGNKALQIVSEFARTEDESLAQRPAAAALLCWGEAGRAALARNATSTPSVKNLLSAFQLLSVGASGTRITTDHFYISNQELVDRINATLDEKDLQLSSREYLAEVFQNLDTDDLMIPLGTAFATLPVHGNLSSAELVRAMSVRWLKLGPSVLAEFEALLKMRSADEPAFQRFFSDHPQMLDPMAVQVWSQPDFHGAHEPDFLIRRVRPGN